MEAAVKSKFMEIYGRDKLWKGIKMNKLKAKHHFEAEMENLLLKDC